MSGPAVLILFSGPVCLPLFCIASYLLIHYTHKHSLGHEVIVKLVSRARLTRGGGGGGGGGGGVSLATMDSILCHGKCGLIMHKINRLLCASYY